jgi:hypothetical protein
MPFSLVGPNIFFKTFLSKTISLLLIVYFSVHVSHACVTTGLLKKAKCFINVLEFAVSGEFTFIVTLECQVFYFVIKTMLHCFLLKMFVKTFCSSCVPFGFLVIQFRGVFIFVCARSEVLCTSS